MELEQCMFYTMVFGCFPGALIILFNPKAEHKCVVWLYVYLVAQFLAVFVFWALYWMYRAVQYALGG